VEVKVLQGLLVLLEAMELQELLVWELLELQA
jgi:hypothetical protein